MLGFVDAVTSAWPCMMPMMSQTVLTSTNSRACQWRGGAEAGIENAGDVHDDRIRSRQVEDIFRIAHQFIARLQSELFRRRRPQHAIRKPCHLGAAGDVQMAEIKIFQSRADDGNVAGSEFRENRQAGRQAAVVNRVDVAHGQKSCDGLLRK